MSIPLILRKPAAQVLPGHPAGDIANHDSATALAERELAGPGEDCPNCGGWGRLTCAACDGTTSFTEASESAGLYQREAARRLGRCAWCDEWGEVMCPECEGMCFVGLDGLC